MRTGDDTANIVIIDRDGSLSMRPRGGRKHESGDSQCCHQTR
jgi:hypothetical protein